MVLIKKAFTDEFVIPEFSKFADQIQEMYDLCRDNDDGAVRSTITLHHLVNDVTGTV